MPAGDHDESELLLLQEARRGAQKALDSLVRQQRDLDHAAASRTTMTTEVLSPARLADGQQAVAQAIESARRTLEQIDADLCRRSSHPPG